MKTGAQTWRDLLFLHYEVPHAWLRERVPPELELDAFDGRVFVGIVPFTMGHVWFGPVYGGTFLETNVRTYVRSGDNSGVFFLSLDCNRRVVVAAARATYHLPYFHARMRSTVEGDTTDYELMRGDAHLAVKWTRLGEPSHSAPGSLAHFLTERYSLFGTRRGGDIYRLPVAHQPWTLSPARVDHLDTNLVPGSPIDLVLATRDGVRARTFSRDRR
jgi:uncharacterized protein YqjF (DUF2071 family)